MKKLLIPSALLCLSTLISACGGGGGDTPPQTSKFALTVNVAGIPSAPVKIVNTTSQAIVFEGALAGSKTFSDIAAGDVLSIQGNEVNGYIEPALQRVTLDGNKNVTLDYKATSQAGAAWRNTSIDGQVTGTDLQLNAAYLGSNNDAFYGKTTLSNNVVAFDLSALIPGQRELLSNYYGNGCNGDNSDSSANVYVSAGLTTYSPQGDLLGYIQEKIVAGPSATLPGAILGRMYADRPFTFKGKCTYGDGFGTTYTDDIDIKVTKGWNTLVFSQTGTAFVTRNAATTDRIEMTFASIAPHVSVNLDQTQLTFTDNETVTVNATLIQVGNYSGTVNLNTNLPGLTVEPATLTLNPLPKLTTQTVMSHTPHLASLGLRPQMLNTKLTFKYSGPDNLYSQHFFLSLTDPSGQQVGQGYGTITVYHPGISLSVYPPELELAPNTTRSISASLTSVGNFSGDVTLSVSGLPAGVTAADKTVGLQYYSSAELILTSGPSVKGGTYPLTVTAQGNGKSASAVLNLVVPKPSVSINLETSSLAVAQGEKATIGVTVQSRNGFSGSATVQLTGLPNGITSAPTTVMVTPNTTTTVRLPVTATASATLGEAQVTVTSPDLDPQQSSYGNTFALTVRPARTALGNNVSSIFVPGNSGVWTLTSSYNSSTFATTSTFKHLVDGKVTATATINGEINKAYALLDGSILAYYFYDAKAYLINDTGVQTLSNRPSGVAGDYTSNAVADDQGRLWFTQENSSGAMTTYSLTSWNPLTSTVKSYPATNELTYFGSYLASNDGKRIVYQASNSADFKIDTATGELSSLGANIPASYGNAAIKNDGVIYFTEMYNGSLKRLNLDGTITGFLEFNNIYGMIGLDRANDNYLWVTTYYGIAKINLLTSAMTVTRFDSISGKVLLSEGGLGVLSTESTPSGSGTQAYLTIVR